MKKLFWVNIIIVVSLFSCVSSEDSVDLSIEYFNVGNAFYEVGQLEKAEEYYLKVLELDENYHKARYNLIQLYVETEDFVLADEQIDYLESIDKENLKIKRLKAYIKYTEEDLTEALNIYLNVFEEGDTSDGTKLNICKLYYQLEEYDKALNFVSQLLLDSDDESLYYIAGMTSYKANKSDLATEYFMSYIDAGGKNIDVFNSLAEIYDSKSDIDNLKYVLELMKDSKDEDVVSSVTFRLARLTLIYENDFSLGYQYLEDAIKSGFTDLVSIEELLENPDLIEKEKIRQLFIDNNIID